MCARTTTVSIGHWFACLAAALSLWSGSMISSAAPINWDNPAGGAFEQASHWNPQQVPGPDDMAVFDLQAVYTVDFGIDPSNQQLIVRHGEVTFDLGGQTYTLTEPTEYSVIIGQASGDDAALTISGGVLTGGHSAIGLHAGTQGMVLVTGDGSTWTNSGFLDIGPGGSGWLTIANGGSASNTAAFIRVGSGSTGTATVAGSGSAVAHQAVPEPACPAILLGAAVMISCMRGKML